MKLYQIIRVDEAAEDFGVCIFFDASNKGGGKKASIKGNRGLGSNCDESGRVVEDGAPIANDGATVTQGKQRGEVFGIGAAIHTSVEVASTEDGFVFIQQLKTNDVDKMTVFGAELPPLAHHELAAGYEAVDHSNIGADADAKVMVQSLPFVEYRSVGSFLTAVEETNISQSQMDVPKFGQGSCVVSEENASVFQTHDL